MQLSELQSNHSSGTLHDGVDDGVHEDPRDPIPIIAILQLAAVLCNPLASPRLPRLSCPTVGQTSATKALAVKLNVDKYLILAMDGGWR